MLRITVCNTCDMDVLQIQLVILGILSLNIFLLILILK